MQYPSTPKSPANSWALRILLVVMITVTLSCTILSSDGDDEDDDSKKSTEIALGIQQTMAAQQAAKPPTKEPELPTPTSPPPPASPTSEIQEIPPTDAQIPVEEEQTGMINASASLPGDVYYIESFEDMPGWQTLSMHGDPNGYYSEAFDNRLRTKIETQDTWVYHFFEGGGNFQDVRIDLTAENRASNTNFVGMICRYSSQGWYEANILNTGEYAIFYGGPEGLEATVHKGATRLIRTGQKTNEYTLICQGETLSLLINGVEVYSMPLRTGDYRFLDEGLVGLSVSTSYAIPVVVDFLQLILSVP